MFQKIMIIGCPGAGKSTFARILRDKTGLPLFYLDQIWHKPDRSHITREEFDEKIRAIVSQDRWIIDGNYQRTLEMRMQACDTVFFLDIPLEDCLKGAEARIGTVREDLPFFEETFDAEFRQWILDFPEQSLPGIRTLLEKYREKVQIVTFTSREQIDAYAAALPGQRESDSAGGSEGQRVD